jgi:ribosomal protein L29
VDVKAKIDELEKSNVDLKQELIRLKEKAAFAEGLVSNCSRTKCVLWLPPKSL